MLSCDTEDSDDVTERHLLAVTGSMMLSCDTEDSDDVRVTLAGCHGVNDAEL